MAAIDKIYLTSFEEFTAFKDWCEAQPPIKDKYGKEDKISDYLFRHWDDPKYWTDGDRPVMSAPYYIDAYIIRNCPFDFVQEELMLNYGHWSQKRIREYYESVKNWDGKDEYPYWVKLEDFIFNDDGTISVKGLESEKSDYELIKEGKLYDKPYIDKYERGKHFRITKVPPMYGGRKCNYPTPIRCKKGAKFTPLWDISILLPDYVDEGYMSWSAQSGYRHSVGTWDFCTEHVLSSNGWSSSNAHCKSISALTRRITKWNLPVGTIIWVLGRYIGEEYKIVVKK